VQYWEATGQRSEVAAEYWKLTDSQRSYSADWKLRVQHSGSAVQMAVTDSAVQPVQHRELQHSGVQRSAVLELTAQRSAAIVQYCSSQHSESGQRAGCRTAVTDSTSADELTAAQCSAVHLELTDSAVQCSGRLQAHRQDSQRAGSTL